VTATYKSSRIKQYFKEHKALRTETTINDTRDFGIGRCVLKENWRALRSVGDHANMRLLDAQAQDANPGLDVVTFERVTRPSTSDNGLYAPSLRFGDPRVRSILIALCRFSHVLAGFTNASLCALVEAMSTATTPHGRRPMTLGGLGATDSSSASTGLTATS